MSEDENQWKWNKFVEIGNTIQKLKGQAGIIQAQYALNIIEELVKCKYVNKAPIANQQLYKTLLYKIASYLDGNAEEIQTAVERYFLIRHCKAGLDENHFQVSFAPKLSGIQTGYTCDVTDGSLTTGFFVKTHQNGPTEDHPESLKPPDMKELFIYQFLHHIGLGPEVHFIVPSHGSKRTLFIATKDCHLTLLSELTRDTMNIKALVQLDLISQILCIHDCATNASNCGQVDGKPMIVDFHIDNQSNGYFTSDILNNFCQGNGGFNYDGLMAEAVGIPREQKLSILSDSLQEWNLLENVDRTVLEMRPIIQRIVTKVKVDDDLHRYVQDVKKTVKILLQV